MADNAEYCKAMLVAKGIKNTRQRLAVLDVLVSSGKPLTAEEIYLEVRDSCDNLSLSTVYRILDTLCKKDIVTRSGLMEGGRALFELISDVHSHNLICIKCHDIIPLDGCPLLSFENELAKTTGYSISGHKLEVYGICPKCNK